MDSRLVLTVLCVTLSLTTYATAVPTANMTTASSHNMSMSTTPAPGNMSMSTTPAPGNMSMSTTPAPGNMSMSTTPAPGNMSTSTTLAPANTSTTSMMTTAAPLTPNTTVDKLESPVSSTDCGTQQLCASQPSDCDPSVAGSCFFLSAKQISGQNFEFGLSGESAGYIAATLSPDSTVGDNDTSYVCANDNGEVRFFSARLLDGELTVTELNVNSVKGSVNGSKIQCTFAATVETSPSRASGVTLSISTGDYNSTSGRLGNPTSQFRGSVADLANVNATVTNELMANSTTAPPATTAHGVTFQQSLMQALLITMGALGLFVV